jgi:glycosyltransferase involved in cell wall biosynthesis
VAQVNSVVLVLPTYLPESFGGAEQQARKLAFALANLGIRVSLLAPRLLRSTARREQDCSISLWRFKVRKPPNLGGRYFGSLLAWSVKLFWWLLWHRNDYDVIHIIHGRLHAVPAVLAGFCLGKPTLIKIGRGGAEHFDLDILNRKKVLGRWYARRLVNHASAYIANSTEIAADLRRWDIPASRIHRIPNGVEIPSLRAASRDVMKVRCIYVGRLDPEKSLDLMIRGFARLPADRSTNLTIVGEGSCRRALVTLVEEFGLASRVSFAGALSDIGPTMRNADVFVSTSISEGMSNALLEAMSFGVMPLVSVVSGVTDLIEDGRSGLLFAAGDLDAFSDRLLDAIDLSPDDRRAIARAARETVVSRFAIDGVAQRHIGVYSALAVRQ